MSEHRMHNAIEDSGKGEPLTVEVCRCRQWRDERHHTYGPGPGQEYICLTCNEPIREVEVVPRQAAVEELAREAVRLFNELLAARTSDAVIVAEMDAAMDKLGAALDQAEDLGLVG